jgi:hypothetical protein
MNPLLPFHFFAKLSPSYEVYSKVHLYPPIPAHVVTMENMAGLALEGGDPRDPHHPAIGDSEPVETQMLHSIHDPSVTFEEYMYYAAITRAEEKDANERYVAAAGPKTLKSIVLGRFSKGHVTPGTPVVPDSPVTDTASSTGEKNPGLDEKGENGAIAPSPQRRLGGVTDSEWKNASRAVRTAGWSGVFYLITTDILGPFSVPWAFAQMGYGPGIALYTVFGGLAM